MAHAVLICSGARVPAARLLDHPLLDRLSIITEHGHTARYPDGVAVETVGSVHDVDEVLAAAWRIAGRHPLDGVLAPYEVGLPAAGYVRTVLGLPGPDFTTATLFTNKHAMKQRLAAAGLPLMPFAGAHSDAQVRARAAEFGWPVVVKPAYGGGSKDVAVVADAAELDAWLAGGGSPRPRNPTAVVERRADILVEYHCDGVVHDGAVRSVVTSRYLEPVLGRIGQGDPYGSYQLPSDHPEHRAVAELHAAAVAALGLRSGVTHLEVFGTPDGLRVSEVACRPGGGAIPAAIQLRSGVDLVDACVRTSLGLPPFPDGTPAPARTDARYVGHCGLALRPGTITELSTEAELAALPGVLNVVLHQRVGDRIAGHIYSASAAGFVHVGADTEEEVRERLATVRAAYRIRTRPDGTGQDGTGSDGTGQDGTGQDGTGPESTRPEGPGSESAAPDSTVPDRTAPDTTDPRPPTPDHAAPAAPARPVAEAVAS
ncbi:ATP-grasp domain-containing protein [Streptomyces bacillaris]|uniref:ATP-grasp domain-containing protein n=1 Tax=Streptomyces bacillaris TaxID=68179 RepID=UPI0037F97A65